MIKVIIWLILSASMFAGAWWLTQKVTAVNGQPVFNPQLRLAPTHAEKQPMTAAEILGENIRHPPRIQTIAIFTRSSTDDVSQKFSLSYNASHDGANPSIEVIFPPAIEAKILLDNLMDEKSCSAFAMLPNDDFGNEIPVSIAKDVELRKAYYLVTPAKSDTSISLNCKLTSISITHTYTKQSAEFHFLGNGSDISYLKEVYPNLDSALSGYAPLPKETVSFEGIAGADEFQFDGGYQDQNLASFESSREIAPGQYVKITWTDVNHEQFRDLLLIVIGTLVAIAVTMFVEALRLIMDFPRMFAVIPKFIDKNW